MSSFIGKKSSFIMNPATKGKQILLFQKSYAVKMC